MEGEDGSLKSWTWESEYNLLVEHKWSKPLRKWQAEAVRGQLDSHLLNATQYTGNYDCETWNPVITSQSDPFNLNITCK